MMKMERPRGSLEAEARSGEEVTALPEPGELLPRPLRLLAPVPGPLDVRGLAEDAGRDEGADVHPDAVVGGGVPADRRPGRGFSRTKMSWVARRPGCT